MCAVKLMFIVVMKPEQIFKVEISGKRRVSRCVLKFNAYCIEVSKVFLNNLVSK